MAIPTSVIRSAPAALTARAMPKSATMAWPACRRMFSGLMSRCTTSRAWAYASASATCVTSRIASSWDRTFSRAHEGAQRLALDVGHDIEQQPWVVGRGLCVDNAAVVQRKNVRMLQVGGGADLAQEAVGADGGGQLGAQNLDRHLSLMPEVAGEIDRRHAALTQFTLDAVAVGKRSGEPGQRVAHGPNIGRRPSRGHCNDRRAISLPRPFAPGYVSRTRNQELRRNA